MLRDIIDAMCLIIVGAVGMRLSDWFSSGRPGGDLFMWTAIIIVSILIVYERKLN